MLSAILLKTSQASQNYIIIISCKRSAHFVSLPFFDENDYSGEAEETVKESTTFNGATCKESTYL